MKMSVKRKLWLGFLSGLLVLPPIFGVMFWAMGSTEALLDKQAALVQQIRVGSELQRALDQAPAAPSSVERASLNGRVEELATLAQKTGSDRRARELAVQVASLGLGADDAARRTAVVAARALVDQSWVDYDASRKELFEVRDVTQRVNFFVLLGAVAAALVLASLISRSLTRPLEELTKAAQRIASGDLREGVSIPSDRELRELAQSFNAMRENLDGALTRMRNHARDVAEAATSVSAATSQMASGAQQQSAATEETSSAMEEIAAQIQGVSRNAVDLADDSGSAASSARQIGASSEAVVRAAQELHSAVDRVTESVDTVARTAQDSSRNLRDADEFARKINSEAEAGGKALDTSVQQIDELGRSSREASRAFESLGQRSRQITSIVQMMGEIADQTNLLALNAAIEAARAGESGRGFAVVAEEVRKLAERAIAAAKEVSTLVDSIREETDGTVALARDTAQRTNEGARLLADTGQRMRRVVESVHQVSALVAQVANAVGDQSRSANELRHEVERLRGLSSGLSQTANAQVTAANGVIGAVERMSERTRQVADATIQVRAGGDQVVKAVENISVVARQNQDAVQRVSGAMKGLVERAAAFEGGAGFGGEARA